MLTNWRCIPRVVLRTDRERTYARPSYISERWSASRITPAYLASHHGVVLYIVWIENIWTLGPRSEYNYTNRLTEITLSTEQCSRIGRNVAEGSVIVYIYLELLVVLLCLTRVARRWVFSLEVSLTSLVSHIYCDWSMTRCAEQRSYMPIGQTQMMNSRGSPL